MSRHVTMATWSDVPHLSAATTAELLRAIPPWHRDARTKGIPQMGAGAIYPVPESEITVDPFDIPPHWPRAFGMDAGGGVRPTAAVWGAEDPESHVIYLYSSHRASSAEPVIHATAIKSRGIWIPGRGDVSALIMTPHDAEQLLSVYRKLGLTLDLADKAVETGLYEVWTLLSTGQVKVFKPLTAWFEEYRLYRRDEKGHIVKHHDHLMDSSRYLLHGERGWWKRKPPRGVAQKPRQVFDGRRGERGSPGSLGWMG